MSLTRNDWLEMWALIKLIESNTKSIRLRGLNPYDGDTTRKIINQVSIECNKIKKQIESVIGEME